jgi:hypothetical protein
MRRMAQSGGVTIPPHLLQPRVGAPSAPLPRILRGSSGTPENRAIHRLPHAMTTNTPASHGARIIDGKARSESVRASLRARIAAAGRRVRLDALLVGDDRAAGIYAREHRSPAAVLRSLDKALRDELETTEMFLTVFYGVLDPAAGSESGRIGNLNPQSALKKK